MNLRFALLAIAVTLSAAANPGVEIQLNESFLTYMKNEALGALTGIIEGQAIPDAGGKDGIFEYDISDIKVTKFSAPTSSVSLPLTPPHGLTAKLSGISVSITAHYKLTEHLIFKVHESGTIDISANADASLDLQIDQKNQRPYVNVGACSGGISDLHIEFHGGLFNKILDLLKKFIEDLVEKELKGIMCKEVTAMATGTMNPILQGIPVTTALMPGFFLDYAVTNSAQVVGNTIVAPFLGKVYYQGHQNDAGIPQAGAMAAVNNNDHLCFKLDLNEVIGSSAYAGITSGKLNLPISATDLVNMGLHGVLDCSCTSGPKCLASSFPGMKAICGLTQSMTLDISMNKMPSVSSNSQGMTIMFTGEATFSFKGKKYVTLQAVAGATVPPNGLSFENWLIKANLKADTGKLTVLYQDHSISHIADETLSAVWSSVISVIFQAQMDKLGAQGFRLPTIPQITPQKATFIMASGSLAVCDNFVLHITK